MRAKASVLRAAFSLIASNGLPSASTATLRRVDENSSASIVIRDAARGFTERCNLHVPVNAGRRQRRRAASEPALDPLNHHDDRWIINELFEARADDLARAIQPVEIGRASCRDRGWNVGCD